MTQLALMFAEAPRVPDAVINESDVLIGNRITRFYGTGRSCRVEIELAHVGDQWSYGASIQAGHTGSSFAPSFKWNEFDSFEAAEREAVAYATERLRSMAHKDADQCVRRAAADLLRMLEQAQYTEQTESA